MKIDIDRHELLSLVQCLSGLEDKALLLKERADWVIEKVQDLKGRVEHLVKYDNGNNSKKGEP